MEQVAIKHTAQYLDQFFVENFESQCNFIFQLSLVPLKTLEALQQMFYEDIYRHMCSGFCLLYEQDQLELIVRANIFRHRQLH
jgi:hypothetical protein